MEMLMLTLMSKKSINLQNYSKFPYFFHTNFRSVVDLQFDQVLLKKVARFPSMESYLSAYFSTAKGKSCLTNQHLQKELNVL